LNTSSTSHSDGRQRWRFESRTIPTLLIVPELGPAPCRASCQHTQRVLRIRRGRLLRGAYVCCMFTPSRIRSRCNCVRAQQDDGGSDDDGGGTAEDAAHRRSSRLSEAGDYGGRLMSVTNESASAPFAASFPSVGRTHLQLTSGLLAGTSNRRGRSTATSSRTHGERRLHCPLVVSQSSR